MMIYGKRNVRAGFLMYQSIFFWGCWNDILVCSSFVLSWFSIEFLLDQPFGIIEPFFFSFLYNDMDMGRMD